MSQTLYRKYRSQRFAELIGQSAVVRVLRNSITRERIGHAYLFSGPRGTGKTSIARIFAKAINCEHPQDGDCDGVCPVCLSIASGSNLDVIEIDAASNRGIDDIRDLRDRVSYAPLELRRKVYIIDEVHMITPQGFNALLKTLEEPPSHVVFCLCTTEANKVPVTILSRCIRFDFQRLPLPELAAHLEWIGGQEGFALDAGVSLKLATLAEGSARDAISLLDQLTVYCEGRIALADVTQLFQLGDPARVLAIVDALAAGEADGALAGWAELLARGVDAGTFLLQLAEELKQRFLASPSHEYSAALECAWQGLNLLKYDNFPALLVELTLLQAAAAFHPLHSKSDAAPHGRTDATAAHSAVPSRGADTLGAAGIPALQDQLGKSPRPTDPDLGARPASARALEVSRSGDRRPEDGHSSEVQPPPREQSESPTKVTAPTVAHATGTLVPPERFETYCAEVKRRKVTTSALLHNGVTAMLDGNRLELLFDPESRAFGFTIAGKPENLELLSGAARSVFGPDTVLEIALAGSAPASASPTAKSNDSAPPEEEAGRRATIEDVHRLLGVKESDSDEIN